MSATQVILLERVENLGNMGEIVSVKPGYARNYLLPQKKAMRASKENVAYFETQKKSLEAANEKNRKEAEKNANPLENLNVAIIRQASEGGQLFGSVTARDIAEAASAASKVAVDKTMITLNQNFKNLGLFPVAIYLHPEVKVDIVVNIARNEDEAKIQKDTGRAITEEAPVVEKAAKSTIDEANLSAALEDDALEAAKADAEAEAAEEAEAAAKAAVKAEEKAAKAAAKAATEAETAESEEASEEASEEE
jgi:large subunit ribosomal protein L9